MKLKVKSDAAPGLGSKVLITNGRRSTKANSSEVESHPVYLWYDSGGVTMLAVYRVKEIMKEIACLMKKQ